MDYKIRAIIFNLSPESALKLSLSLSGRHEVFYAKSSRLYAVAIFATQLILTEVV